MTYNNRPLLENQINSLTNTNIKYNWAEADITAEVRAKLGQMMSLGIDSSGSNTFNVYSRNSLLLDDRPQLVLTYY